MLSHSLQSQLTSLAVRSLVLPTGPSLISRGTVNNTGPLTYDFIGVICKILPEFEFKTFKK